MISIIIHGNLIHLNYKIKKLCESNVKISTQKLDSTFHQNNLTFKNIHRHFIY